MKRSVICRAPGNYDVDEASYVSALEVKGPSRTIQSQREEADINVIVKRFGITGQVPVVERPPLVEDFDGVFDYQSAMNLIIAADRSFAAMPADVRARFGNDPAQFVDFCSDEANLDELRKLGLAVPMKEVPEPEAKPSPAPAGS